MWFGYNVPISVADMIQISLFFCCICCVGEFRVDACYLEVVEKYLVERWLGQGDNALW